MPRWFAMMFPMGSLYLARSCHPAASEWFRSRERLGWIAGLACFWSVFWGIPEADGATSVKLGTVKSIAGPADLDLTGDFVYAINFSTDDPARTVRGVTFLPDNRPIPGATLIGPQNVTPWQTKPEFGSSSDANQLEEILADIRWANTGGGERLRATLAVTVGEDYQLQILISGNTEEDRRWDIRVGGREAVDEITSLGVSPGQTYSPNRATLYTYRFTAEIPNVVVEMGQLFGANDGGDRNPIWQALTLERVTVPPTPDDVTVSATRFFAGQTTPFTRFGVVDRRSGATHMLALVTGAGDADNAKFRLEGADLVSSGFDFASVPPGTAFAIRVRATDAADARRSLEKAFVLTVEAPDRPSGLVLDAASVASEVASGSLLARVRVEDPDPFDRHVITLVAGDGDADNGLLTLVGDEVRAGAATWGGRRVLRFRLRATDLAGLSTESSFALPVEAVRLRINEVLASEVTGVGSATGLPEEWIELSNPASHVVDLGGWHLTDDPEAPTKWTFPAGVRLPPGGFLVVLMDGSEVPPAGSTNLHASFSLDAGGEWLGVVGPDGRTVVADLRFPAQFPGVAYGYGPDGTSLGHLPVPTPGATNGPVAEAGENRVEFSRARGFCTNAFELTLGATLPGSTVRYTVDGSLPSATTGTVYSGPILVTPNTAGATRGVRIVRALAVHPRAAYARVATHTYLFVNGVASPSTDGIVTQSRFVNSIRTNAVYGPLLDDALLALPALSVNMSGGPVATERRASLELFDPEGREPGFQVECGVTSTGTTSLSSPKLSMAARFRSEYGAARLRYPVFGRGSMVGGRAADEFNELRLRSHSHDTFHWLGTRENPPVPYGSPAVTRSGDAQLTRNPWIDEMQLAMGQPGKRGRQVHLYLNGAYHGIYHVHEHADEDFMASYYGGDREDYHFTGAALGGSTHDGGDSWRTTWSSVKSSLGTYAQAQRWIDVTNLCDYMVLSFYAGNDWDWSAQHNWSAAGPRLPDRGGWKFFQQDSDIVLQDVAADCTDQAVPDGIFTALMRFPDFKVLFRDRVAKHCFGEGMLTPAKAAAFYDARMNEIAVAIVAETARWQPSSSIAALPWDRDQEWTNEWRYLRNTFFPQRTARVLQQFRARGWWSLNLPEPNVPEGRVPLGQQIAFSSSAGAVYYTTDGSDPRLPGGGINPAAKARITGTTERVLSPAGATWRFLDDGTDPGPSWTGFDFDDARWKSGVAEIGYGDGNEATTSGFVDADPAAAGVQKNITTYFRRTFDVADILSLRELKLRLRRDDGAVVYLNGREIWRVNLPDGPITSTTRAVTGIGDVDETTFLEQTMGAALVFFREKGNVLAVEMHQQSPESSDISFDFELIGIGQGVTADPMLVIDAPKMVRARAYSGTDWSGLVEAFYLPEGVAHPSADNLLLSEIQYHPLDDADAEFLEFLNASTAPVDLSGVVLTNAVRFVFPRGTVLAAGERVVVAKDPAAFDARHVNPSSPYSRAGVRRWGPWEGSLGNGGETLDVVGADGVRLFSCAYHTDATWPGRADGRGSSLELADEAAIPRGTAARTRFLSSSESWRPSGEFHGSPGWRGAGPDNRVVVNEIASDGTDAIELLNRSGAAVEMGGWFVSDSSANYRKYRMPGGTRLAPGERLVLREADFNNPANPQSLQGFELSMNGDDVFLVSANGDGALLRFVDRVEWGEVPSGATLGRWPDGTGPLRVLEGASLGQANRPPLSGFGAWTHTAFAEGVPLAERAPGADPDGDGYSNFAEYAFVQSPNVPDDPPLRVLGVDADGGLRVAFRVRAGASDVAYELEWAETLGVWAASGDRMIEVARATEPDGAVWVTAVLAGDRGTTARFVRLAARSR